MMDAIKNILALIISLSTVLGIFTKILNRVFDNKLDPINKRMDDSEKINFEDRMQNARFSIVNFASELRHGIPKSRFQYEAIFQYMNFYEHAVKKLGIENNLFEQEKEYIIAKYKELDK